MKEHEIQTNLKEWLPYHFKDSNLFLREEVVANINEFKMRADLIVIQSKSNVIHAFEVKNKITSENILSAIWQANSYYSNYRWLVVPIEYIKIFSKEKEDIKFNDLGVGIISFDPDANNKFNIFKKADYKDGNFLKFWPTLVNEWTHKLIIS